MIKKQVLPELSVQEAEAILQEVFLECYQDTNSIPVEQMEQYSVYRTEKLSLQKNIAIIGCVAFLLLPLFFVAPRFTVTETPKGSRNLPVYQIEVKGILPIQSVQAIQNGYSLPVYQKASRTFTVEPTSNGEMTVAVYLFSKQWYTRKLVVNLVDDEAPVYVGSSYNGNELYIYVSDVGTGIDYNSAFIKDKDGTITYPDGYDAYEGYFEISEIPEDGALFVYDLRGNELRVSIKNKGQ